MSEAAETGTRQYPEIPEVPERGGISGAVVHVHLAVVLGAVAMVFDLGLLWVVIAGTHLWWGLPLVVVALGLSVYAAYLGIYGVIRYGLFTEGCGAGEVAGELHRSKIAWIAGVVSQVTGLFTVALTIALIVRALV